MAGFFQGAGFEHGISGEVRATIVTLDALDHERAMSFGTRARERTAAESDTHHVLVHSLMSDLAQRSGEITHADDSGTLPQPPLVGRHHPDLVGRTPHCDLFIGEAKLGPELFDEHTQEQLADFGSFAPDGERVPLHLIVPAGWREEAERAVRAAVGTVDDYIVIHEVAGLQTAPPPST